MSSEVFDFPFCEVRTFPVLSMNMGSYFWLMALELTQPSLQELFESTIQTEDRLKIRDFLDDQNISDVAHLVDEYPEYQSQIIANMSVHRAASVFKILDLSVQKTVIRPIPPPPY
jgi:magnesium transporter